MLQVYGVLFSGTLCTVKLVFNRNWRTLKKWHLLMNWERLSCQTLSLAARSGVSLKYRQVGMGS